MTALLQEEPAVRQAYDKYLKFNSDARMRALDEAHQRFMHDQASELEAAVKKGEAKGREEGFAIGEARGKAERDHEIAESMKRKGYSISDIAELTGLSSNVIEQLR